MPMDTPALWTAPQALDATGGALSGRPDWSAYGVSIDTRTIEPGDLFVALEGVRDGHEFVAQAFEKGAGAALVTRKPEGVDDDAPLLIVEDTLKGVERLGIARRADVDARICGITGSVGKTGTKEALRLALEPGGATHAPTKSFNNHIGVPLTLARMPEHTRFGVFEIGMNHAGEITPLSQMVRPQVAIVTTVEAVHLEFFDSVEGIAEAKAEIFHGLEDGGTAILNADNRYHQLLTARALERGAGRVLSFSVRDKADACVLDMRADAEGTEVKASILGREMAYHLGVPGRHHVLNSLAVLTAAACMDADLDLAAAGLSRLRAQAGRGERHEVTGAGDLVFTLIDESYNANPASMTAAVLSLGELEPRPGGRRIAVLGDMLDLGETGPKLHAGLHEVLEEQGIGLVFCAGPLMKHLYEALPEHMRGAWGETSAELQPQVAGALQTGDIVMIKGSLGSKMRPIVDELLAKHGKQGYHQ